MMPPSSPGEPITSEGHVKYTDLLQFSKDLGSSHKELTENQ